MLPLDQLSRQTSGFLRHLSEASENPRLDLKYRVVPREL